MAHDVLIAVFVFAIEHLTRNAELTMKRWLGLLSVAGLLLVLTPTVGGQTPETRRVMREKLTHGQRILEALTTSNYALLEHESDALSRITASPQWEVLKTPEFAGYSSDFRSAAQALAEAARERDLDAAAERYPALVTSCYACHRYLKGRRIAR